MSAPPLPNSNYIANPAPYQNFQANQNTPPHPPYPNYTQGLQQPFQNYPPDQNIIPQQPPQNFYNPVMGDHMNPGYPPQGTPGYQAQGTPGYPPQGTPGYPPQGTPGYPPQQPQVSPGYPPQQQPQVSPGYPPTTGYPPTGQYQGGSGLPPPTAPDITSMQPIPGYEGLTFEQTTLTPPVVPEWQPSGDDRKAIQNLPNFSEEEVRDAVVQYASENCCYGSAPAKDMQMRDIQMSSAFHYKLETFTEKRESSWKFEPYNGQPIDGPQNGPPPSPWEVMAIPQNYFTDSKVKIEVPHTAFTRPCHACIGNGRVRCETCYGNGRKQCTWCKGRGRVTRFDKDEICTSCNATGFDRCFKCTGTGQVKCKVCDARGNLKGFVELIVTWTNHVDNYISEVACMPKELVLEVSGQNAYEEENPRVFPIVQGAEEGVCKASSDLIQKHGSAYTNERILKQKQNLRIIPIAQVKFEFGGKTDKFCVYGYEHKVYFKDYPQKCCCVIS